MQTLTMYTNNDNENHVTKSIVYVSFLNGFIEVDKGDDIIELTFEQVKEIYDMIKRKELQQ